MGSNTTLKGVIATVGLVVLAAVVGLAASVGLAYLSFASGGKQTWYLTRASGIVAYATLALATIWGLLTSSRLLMKWVKLPLTSEVHQTLSLISLVVIAFHGWVLLYDVEFGFTLRNLLVPFTSPYRPAAVAAGVGAGYIAAIVSVSFYVRHILGQKTWRIMHYATFGAFASALVHGIWTGSDSRSLAMGLLYAISGALVLFLTYVRMLGGRYTASRRTPKHLVSRPSPPDVAPVVDQGL